MREDFALIPVIDLKDGVVVHARAGKRADYRPLETSFGLADDPVAIARALLAVTGSPILYVADLDAIAGTGHHFERAVFSSPPRSIPVPLRKTRSPFSNNSSGRNHRLEHAPLSETELLTGQSIVVDGGKTAA